MTLSALASAAVFCLAVGVSAQQPVPRTPWGDPDLQGVYTNSNESGIPMERPAEFAGKRLDEVQPAGLARLVAQRAEQVKKTARGIPGSMMPAIYGNEGLAGHSERCPRG